MGPATISHDIKRIRTAGLSHSCAGPLYLPCSGWSRCPLAEGRIRWPGRLAHSAPAAQRGSKQFPPPELRFLPDAGLPALPGRPILRALGPGWCPVPTPRWVLTPSLSWLVRPKSSRVLAMDRPIRGSRSGKGGLRASPLLRSDDAACQEWWGQRARRNVRLWCPLRKPPRPSEGPEVQETLPPAPLPPEYQRPPFYPHLTPGPMYFVPSRVPNSGSRRPGRATCTPRCSCAPRPGGGASRLPDSARAAAAGWEPAVRAFSLGLACAPASFLPGFFPPPHPVRSPFQSDRAGAACSVAQAVGPVSATPNSGLKPFATQKGQEGLVCPRSSEEEMRLSLSSSQSAFPLSFPFSF